MSPPGSGRSRKNRRANTASTRSRRRCNQLDGRRWLQNSISVWSDIRKSPDEARLNHPAMFPGMLVERLIETFLPPEGRTVLDPFAGSGSTVVTAERMGKRGIGLELSPDYAALANHRLDEVRQAEQPAGAEPAEECDTPASTPAAARGRADAGSAIHCVSAKSLLSVVKPNSIDLCISSPPYWNILNARRTADMKSVRHYGNLPGDLGAVTDYNEFLKEVSAVFADVFVTLKPGAYCCAVVMDLRKKDRFFPLHSDLAGRLSEVGYVFDDLIIWNRQSEYNNLRPLGYPSVFRVNKVHEYVVLLQKPRRSGT